MSELDKTWPFVISHTRWARAPKSRVDRHWRGYIAGTVKLIVNVNRVILDVVETVLEEAFYISEKVVEDEGSGVTRHWAFDVGVEYDQKGGTKPVLKAVETVRAPKCAHHYSINRIDEKGFHDAAPERDLGDILDPRKSADESQPAVESIMADLGVSDSTKPAEKKHAAGDIVESGVDVLVSRNGSSKVVRSVAHEDPDIFRS